MGQFKYSNCLLEAILAKLKNWKNVKILYIPRSFNIDHSSGHFVWTNKTLDPSNSYYFEFCAKKKKHNRIWFEGAVSGTKRYEIERVLNLGLARNKKLRKIEKSFNMKFNVMKLDEMQRLLGKCDWTIVDPDYSPLPKATDFPGYLIFEPYYYEYDPKELKPKILGKIRGSETYKNYYFDENKNVVTNGDDIEWWRWDFYKEPSVHMKEWGND